MRVAASPAGPGVVSARVQLREVGALSGVGGVGGPAGAGAIVAPLARALTREVTGSLCVWNTGRVALAFSGAAVGAGDRVTVTAPGAAPTQMVGRVRVEDLSSARPSSLWPELGRVGERIATATGSGLAPWLVLFGLVGMLAGTIGLLCSPVVGVGVGREGVLCFVVAFSIGACWAGITPAFEKTDETAHFAYVQAFAELGHPPRQFVDDGDLSQELTCWYNGLGIPHYRFFTAERPPWTAGARRALDRQCAGLSPRFEGAMYMAFQPPAYYLLAAGAYKAGGGLALPTRLLFARLVSVLLAALAVVFTYLLVLEVIPGSVWPARAAAFSLALQPVFMFNESGVNPDAMLVAIASAIALLAARAWRKGLSLRRALSLGALVGLGVLSKTNFLALLPSVLALAGALCCAGESKSERRARGGRLAAGAVLAGAIFGLYALVNSAAWHRGLRYRDASYGGHGGSIHKLAEFAWEFFLPIPAGVKNLVAQPGIPFLELIENSTTRLGWWNDYGLASGWTPILMLIGIALAIMASLYILPRARRHPKPLLVALGCGLLFLASLVYAGYQFSLSNAADVIIPRHALPAMSLWGLLVGCAIAALRPTWRPTVTGIIAAVFLAHTTLALTTTISRFYL